MERVVTNKWRNTFKIRSLSVTRQDKYTKLNYFSFLKNFIYYYYWAWEVGDGFGIGNICTPMADSC